MKYIDLLPRKEREFNKRTIALNIVIVFLVIFLGLMAGSVIIFNDLNKNLISSLEKHQQVGIKLQDYASKLEVYSEFEQKVNQKDELIQSVAEKTLVWSDILYNLGQAMPENTHITNYEGSFGDLQKYIEEYSKDTRDRKTSSFTIRGYAKQYLDISKLLINLKKIPYVGDAWIRNISKGQVTEGISGISFNVEAFWDTSKIVEEWEIKEKEDKKTGEEPEEIIEQ